MVYSLDLIDSNSNYVEVFSIGNKCVCKSMNVFPYNKIKTHVFINKCKVFCLR